ncbi:MAG: carbohydrate kinase family protein [Spirochaetaceae bacterium]|nr:carbohydrate kinase family protein [Spirochaetaceae bacterium]
MHADTQRMIAARTRLAKSRVLTIGGANVEHSYRLPGPLRPDAKYSTEPQPRLAGGSSVNHACRLLALGVPVHPVLPIAKADPMSRLVLEALDAAAETGGVSYTRRDLTIRGPALSTPFTTILRDGASRASLNEFSPELMRRYGEHVESHLRAIQESPRRRPDVVMLGHVHADRRPPGRGAPGFSGELSERILTAPELASSRKIVNFGSAQYALGTKRWERILRDEVDVFQLDIGEVRRFCADAELADLSLESILGWFRERCTVVVTLERFGAIGQLVGHAEPIAAWPLLIDEVADSTGAGDALGAGIAASMLVGPFGDESDAAEERLEEFAAALAFGRACGAYACTTIGGASDCPDLEQLTAFERRTRRPSRDDSAQDRVSRHDLFLIDRAFDR